MCVVNHPIKKIVKKNKKIKKPNQLKNKLEHFK